MIWVVFLVRCWRGVGDAVAQTPIPQKLFKYNSRPQPGGMRVDFFAGCLRTEGQAAPRTTNSLICQGPQGVPNGAWRLGCWRTTDKHISSPGAWGHAAPKAPKKENVLVSRCGLGSWGPKAHPTRIIGSLRDLQTKNINHFTGPGGQMPTSK